MKSRNNRLFWTALGSQLLGEDFTEALLGLPAEMQSVFNLQLSLKSSGKLFPGENLSGRKGRHVYMHTWKILRDYSFSRSFREEVFPGVELFIPFVRDRVVVIPQGFRERVPLELRTRALIGKSAALQSVGFTLVVAAAYYDEHVWELLKKGGCFVATPNTLPELIADLF